MRWLLLLVLLLPTVAAKGIPEDASTYPPEVALVSRNQVFAGEELNVLVNTPHEFSQAAMVVCRFKQAADAEPVVCWTQVAAHRIGDVGYAADTTPAMHPRFEAGWTIGYKFILRNETRDVLVPADGGYYRVTIEGTTPAPLGLPLLLAVLLVAGAIEKRK
jgi:hypothetical protein